MRPEEEITPIQEFPANVFIAFNTHIFPGVLE
jgi:hypothetical protein